MAWVGMSAKPGCTTRRTTLCDLMRSTGDFEAALELYQRAQGLYDYAEQIAPDRD